VKEVAVRFSERIVAPVSLHGAWDFVWQADKLARCLPGCTGVDELVPQSKYRAHLEDQLGPYRLRFPLNVSVEQTEPLKLIRVLATGNDEMLGISQRIGLTVGLRELGPRQTALDIEADVVVEGALVKLAGFLVKRKAADIVKQLARNVDRELHAVGQAEASS
jgi:carbon monoxide dehydrogenase subunit G